MTQQTQHISLTDTAKPEIEDTVLMQAIARGDNKALYQLMQRHMAQTVRLATRVLGQEGLAEDVAQEAFIRVWKKAPAWEKQETGGAKFTTWLYRIVINLCIDQKRKKTFIDIDKIPEPVSDTFTPETQMAKKQLSKRVKQQIEKLPERQRVALALCFYEGYSNKEAADMMGTSVKSIESLLVRARRTLRDALDMEKDGS